MNMLGSCGPSYKTSAIFAESGLEFAADKKGRKRKACGIGVFVFRDD